MFPPKLQFTANIQQTHRGYCSCSCGLALMRTTGTTRVRIPCPIRVVRPFNLPSPLLGLSLYGPLAVSFSVSLHCQRHARQFLALQCRLESLAQTVCPSFIAYSAPFQHFSSLSRAHGRLSLDMQDRTAATFKPNPSSH